MPHEVHKHLPKLLVECVTLLERDPENMKSCGLYRVSGSHTTIQKLRFKVTFLINAMIESIIHIIISLLQIDSNNYKMLYEQKNPHNLTGVLKLFFRELKSPIITLGQLDEAIPNRDEFLSKDNAQYPFHSNTDYEIFVHFDRSFKSKDPNCTCENIVSIATENQSGHIGLSNESYHQVCNFSRHSRPHFLL